MSLGITLSAVCSSSLRELISCFRYWISDSLTRSKTCGNNSSVCLHPSRRSTVPRCLPAVPGDSQARAGGSAPRRLHASTAKLLVHPSSGSRKKITTGSLGNLPKLALLMCSLHTPRFLLVPTALCGLNPRGQAGLEKEERVSGLTW